MDELITIEFDGGSRGNPGPAGLGVVLRSADGTPLVTIGRYIGRATNNVAEYQGLIAGLQKAVELKAKRVVVRGDSQLVIRLMNGEYRVKHPSMIPLFEKASDLANGFEQIRFEHNLRHKNQLADKLANLAMDRKAEVTDVNIADDPSPLDVPSVQSPVAGARFSCPRCGCQIGLLTPSSIRPHQLKPFVCQCGMKMGEEGM